MVHAWDMKNVPYTVGHFKCKYMNFYGIGKDWKSNFEQTVITRMLSSMEKLKGCGLK